MDTTERDLRMLLESCKYLRDSSFWVKDKHRQEVSASVWSAFCSQIRHIEKRLPNGS